MSSKPPQLSLGEDKLLSVKIWRKKFDSWCLLQNGYRDLSKEPSEDDHWLAANYQKEIAAFYLSLPEDVMVMFETTIIPKMTADDKKNHGNTHNYLKSTILEQTIYSQIDSNFLTAHKKLGSQLQISKSELGRWCQNASSKTWLTPKTN